MRLFAAFLVAGALVATPAFAQQQDNTTAPQTPAPTDTAPALTKSGKPRAKDVRAECREQVKSQGLKGAERKQAVSDCVLKARPDLAAAEECRQDPNLKGMDKAARKAAIKECVKNKKQSSAQ